MMGAFKKSDEGHLLLTLSVEDTKTSNTRFKNIGRAIAVCFPNPKKCRT
jgi:hypothetical protein